MSLAPLGFSPSGASAIIGWVTPHDLLSLSDALDLFTGPNTHLPDALVQDGLIPPIPLSAGSDPVLVWGWPIVRRAAELGVAELETRTFSLSPADALILALQLEGRAGAYSWAEQAAVVRYLETSPHGDGAGVGAACATARAAGTEVGAADWPAFSRLVRGDGALVELIGRYRKLEPTLRALVNDEFIALKTAERITRVPGEFLSLHRRGLGSLSFSARRQFLELLAELMIQAQAPGGTGTETCAASNVCTRASAALDERDPVAALRRLRYPTLTHLEEQFCGIRRESLHGTGVDLTAPPYFEGESFSVSFTFRNCAELVERTQALERLEGSCDQLFEFL